jgi:hypothetical protein
MLFLLPFPITKYGMLSTIIRAAIAPAKAIYYTSQRLGTAHQTIFVWQIVIIISEQQVIPEKKISAPHDIGLVGCMIRIVRN